jgi:magnesium transporter
MFTLEKSLVYYLNAINSNGVLIEKVKLNSTKFNFNTEELELLDDIVIENNQCYKQAEIYSNILASLMDARASIVSNNLNILIKILNVITIGLMVPTLIVSIFSMNVKLPIFQDHPFSFWFVIGISALSSLIVFVVWRVLKL